jgi:hypothetical protein
MHDIEPATAVAGRTGGAECRLVVRDLLGRPIEERWRDHADGEHVVSDRGRLARLLNVETSTILLLYSWPFWQSRAAAT